MDLHLTDDFTITSVQPTDEQDEASLALKLMGFAFGANFAGVDAAGVDSFGIDFGVADAREPDDQGVGSPSASALCIEVLGCWTCRFADSIADEMQEARKTGIASTRHPAFVMVFRSSLESMINPLAKFLFHPNWRVRHLLFQTATPLFSVARAATRLD